MKRTDFQSIGDVLRLTVQDCRMSGRLDECKAVDMWSSVVGEHLASLCGRPTVKEGLMTISVSAGPLRQELTMNRSSIARHINERLGREVIKDIRFIG